MHEDWVEAAVAGTDHEVTGPPVLHRSRPWADVYRVPTRGEPLWLKVMRPQVAFEAGVYEVFARVRPGGVLLPVAVDRGRGLLLLPHAEPLRPVDLAAVLPVYAELQRALVPHVGALLATGVEDMRAEVMPRRFAEARERIGTTPELDALEPAYARWCEELADSPVPASLDHNDLHDNNFINGINGINGTAGPAFYDWGDSVVAHPFASLLWPLVFLAPDHPRRARAAYLEAFTDLAPRARLERDADLALKVSRVARALVWLRAVGDSGLHGDAPARTLRSVLDER
ncbi:phosphotransferase [Actinokineospora bangkokensis]|uniref:Aminoglycoside phosphotransferase domain-containing protein n=1 Tax=Actinokineospora bangkokensis TaxID=1193682 RepID=A0A1Q9LFP2_9PSEU|nr:phosphotransferase [Actinokineospora bangkokensis]OLR90834.1 hypothetical protein BJP25_30170 [Actinokineospora bangkokensis]